MNPRILKETSSRFPVIFGKRYLHGLRCSNGMKYLNPIASNIKSFLIPNDLIWKSFDSIKRNFVSCNRKDECIMRPIERDKSNDNLNLTIGEKMLSKELDYLKNGEYNDSLKALEHINEVSGISVDVRVALANKVFFKMRCDGNTITKSHYLSLLKCYVKSKYFGDVQKFLSEMKSDGVELDEEIKVSIIKCLSEAGLGKQISEIVEFGEEEKYSLENKEDFFSSLLYSYGISGNLTDALGKFNELKKKGFKARSSIYTSLMRVIAIIGDKSMFNDLYEEVLENEIKFSDDEISSILRDLVVNENFHLLKTVELLSSCENLMKIASELLIELVCQNKIAFAFSLLENLFRNNYDLQFVTIEYCKDMYKLLIETLVNFNHPAVDLLEKCKEFRKVKKLLAFECLLYIYLKNNDMAKSLMTLRVMFNEGIFIQPHYFWPLIIMAYKKYGDNGIIEVLQTMNELHVFIDEETLMDYVFPNLSTPDSVSDVLKRIKFSFLQSQYITEVFMIYACHNCLFKECSKFVMKNYLASGIDFKFLINLYSGYLHDNPNEKYVYHILKELRADPVEILEYLMFRNDTGKIVTFLRNVEEIKWYGKDKKKAAEILQQMPELHKGINTSKLQRLFLNNLESGGFHEKKNSSKYEYIKELEKAEINLEELKTKKMNFFPNGLRVIKLYVKELLYDQAIKVRNNIYKEYGFEHELTPGIMAYFARMGAYENDVKTAMEFFDKIQSFPYESRLNSPSSIVLAALLIKNHHFNEVWRVLTAMPIIRGRSSFVKSHDCSRLLEGIADLGDINKVKKVTDLLLSKNWVFLSGTFANTFIRTYIKANDLENAVKVYFERGFNFETNPSKIPLLKALLKGKRFDLFDEVMELKKYNPFCNQSVLGLILIAGTGDEESLIKYSQRFKLNLSNDLLNGLKMDVDATTYKTIIQAAIKKSQPYDRLVNQAINHIYKAMDYDEVEKFTDFCEHFKIKLDSDTVTNLLNFAELGKIRKSSLIKS